MRVMPEASTRRTALTSQLGQVFRERGYAGATLTQLANAAGIGKASLYHHFPGGKAEMLEVLLRDAMTEAQSRAFARLAGGGTPGERLQRFLDGYADYLRHGNGPCLLGVLALGSARGPYGERLAGQMRDWQAMLVRLFEEAGHKPKRAARSAAEVLDALYGAQLMAALVDDPGHLRRAFKRLSRDLERLLG